VIQKYNCNVKDAERRKSLCGPKGDHGGCDNSDGSIWPPTILFTANFVAGMGGSLYYTLGVSYMDDNIQKAKTPALISEYCHCTDTLFWLYTFVWDSPKILLIFMPADYHSMPCTKPTPSHINIHACRLPQHSVYQTHTLTY
jgi:hypothetical protein